MKSKHCSFFAVACFLAVLFIYRNKDEQFTTSGKSISSAVIEKSSVRSGTHPTSQHTSVVLHRKEDYASIFASIHTNEALAEAIGKTDDPLFFIKGVEKLKLDSKNLNHLQKVPLWSIIVDGIRSKGGATHLFSLFKNSGHDFVDVTKDVTLVGNINLSDYFIQKLLTSPSIDEFQSLNNKIDLLAKSDFYIKWKSNLVSFELMHDLPNAIQKLNQIEDTQIKKSVEPFIIDTLSSFNPSEAAQYFLSGSCIAASKDLAYAALGKLIQREPEGASQLIRDAAPGDQRDFAIVVLVREVLFSDPEAAAIWFDSINNNNIKNDALNYFKRIQQDKIQQDKGFDK